MNVSIKFYIVTFYSCWTYTTVRTRTLFVYPCLSQSHSLASFPSGRGDEYSVTRYAQAGPNKRAIITPLFVRRHRHPDKKKKKTVGRYEASRGVPVLRRRRRRYCSEARDHVLATRPPVTAAAARWGGGNVRRRRPDPAGGSGYGRGATRCSVLTVRRRRRSRRASSRAYDPVGSVLARSPCIGRACCCCSFRAPSFGRRRWRRCRRRPTSRPPRY